MTGPVHVMYRDHDGSVREGWNITSLIDPADLARLEARAIEYYGGKTPAIDLVELGDLDALSALPDPTP